MLQLAINAGYSLDQIRDLFEGPLRQSYLWPLGQSSILPHLIVGMGYVA